MRGGAAREIVRGLAEIPPRRCGTRLFKSIPQRRGVTRNCDEGQARRTCHNVAGHGRAADGATGTGAQIGPVVVSAGTTTSAPRGGTGA